MERFTKKFDILSTTEEMSFPADKPVELLDYIAVKKGTPEIAGTRKSNVVEEPVASDHRPVYACVTMKQATTR